MNQKGVAVTIRIKRVTHTQQRLIDEGHEISTHTQKIVCRVMAHITHTHNFFLDIFIYIPSIVKR